MIELLLVDDHEIVRRGLHELFEVEDDLHVVVQAGSLDEALEARRRRGGRRRARRPPARRQRRGPLPTAARGPSRTRLSDADVLRRRRSPQRVVPRRRARLRVEERSRQRTDHVDPTGRARRDAAHARADRTREGAICADRSPRTSASRVSARRSAGYWTS